MILREKERNYMCDIIELIEEFCTINNLKYYKYYSGRGMFGRHCCGIICNGNMLEVMLRLTDFLYENGIDNLKDVLGTPCWDNMGLDIIIYFPSLSSI